MRRVLRFILLSLPLYVVLGIAVVFGLGFIGTANLFKWLIKKPNEKEKPQWLEAI